MIFNFPSDIKKATDYLNKLQGRVKIEVIRSNRSLNQNSYFHGVVCAVFGLEFGLTIEESKEIFREKFLSYDKKGRIFHKSTASLNTKEFEIFNSKCRQFASENGCFIPLPNEVTDQMLNDIEKNKHYL